MRISVALAFGLSATLLAAACGSSEVGHGLPDAAGSADPADGAGPPVDARVVTSEGGPGGGDGTACRILGAQCFQSNECCTNLCMSGSCAVPQCEADGVACGTAAQCCSGTCTAGLCG